MNKVWYTDPQAEATFKEFERRIGPLVAKLLPSFRMTHLGMKRNESWEAGKDEIQVVLHLRPLGEAYEINERLNAMAVTRNALEKQP